jgi:hypothetical protein
MFGGRKSATFTLVRGNKFGSGGGRASRSGTGAGRATRELSCGIGGIGVFRDAIALVDECDPRCGACTTLIGAWLVGGIGGTGSLCAHTGVEISIHRLVEVIRHLHQDRQTGRR